VAYPISATSPWIRCSAFAQQHLEEGAGWLLLSCNWCRAIVLDSPMPLGLGPHAFCHANFFTSRFCLTCCFRSPSLSFASHVVAIWTSRTIVFKYISPLVASFLGLWRALSSERRALFWFHVTSGLWIKILYTPCSRNIIEYRFFASFVQPEDPAQTRYPAISCNFFCTKLYVK
jgi:hypothetical protein